MLVIAGSSDEEPDPRTRTDRTFHARRVDGLIVVPTGTETSELARLAGQDIPVVCVDRPVGPTSSTPSPWTTGGHP